MDWLADPVMLARIQFAATAIYHFMFVPLSIGFGLILAILQTKAHRTGDAHDAALARFWLKLFTGTFAVGVATGITMEFSFGTNWADYSRFVGDIFGAPLAAEALFAFFLESVFLGILLFGESKVSKRLFLVSAWLVFLGSCLSALWIIIANSWMQTPAGYEVIATDAGSKAILTSFFAAAFNPSTLQRYAHVLASLFVMGTLVCIAVGAYYKLKGKEVDAGDKLLRVGVIAGITCAVLLLPTAHAQAVVVAEQQPAKLAAMEGQYETEPAALTLVGWVDEAGENVIGIAIPGGTSFLADFDFQKEYPGLNDYAPDVRPGGIQIIFQAYHLMVALSGVIILVLLLSLLVLRGKFKNKKWPLRIMMFGWIAPILAIQSGWLTAELGRQPWIVFGELKTADAISQSVDAVQLIITLVLFAVIYTVIYVIWLRVFCRTVKEGPSKCLTDGETSTDAEEVHA